MMFPDYYAILGIAESASQEAVRKAFHARAIAAHPDSGGSHEQMVLVNEAWSILSDPIKRARYDEARNARASLLVRQAAEADAVQARAQAGNYPRHRSELESWFGALSADFTQAQFGRFEGGPTTWPTATNSFSANLFIWGGGILAASLLLISAVPQGAIGKRWDQTLIATTLVGCAGSWLGYWLHRLIAQLLSKPRRRFRETLPPFEQQPAASIVIHCPACGQGLRLPRATTALAVTCPKCRSEFDLPPSFI